MIISQSQLRQSFSDSFVSINAERIKTKQFSRDSAKDKITIFLSHKHDEVKVLEQTIRLLKNCNVDIYVDWMDEGMPKKTCVKTAERLKGKIKNCDRFILIGTEGAINSKWCNWELGQGDIHKFDNDHLSIFPIKSDYEDYSGNEYIELYPTIQYEDGATGYVIKEFDDGKVFYVPPVKDVNRPILGHIPKGYYVHVQHDADDQIIQILIKLEDWLKG